MLIRIVVVTVLALSGFDGVRAAGYPEFDEPTLKLGRQVWLGTCEACHANSMSEAPQARNPAAWEPRIAKGRDVLYSHALNGFTGKSGEEMPPRGGNSNLSDGDVKAALEYMLKLVELSKGEMK
jgi:cytochrome c5